MVQKSQQCNVGAGKFRELLNLQRWVSGILKLLSSLVFPTTAYGQLSGSQKWIEICLSRDQNGILIRVRMVSTPLWQFPYSSCIFSCWLVWCKFPLIELRWVQWEGLGILENCFYKQFFYNFKDEIWSREVPVPWVKL